MKKIIAPAAAVIAACSAAPVAMADAPGAAASRTIVVNGLGEAAGAPDMAVLSVGVDAQAPTAAQALKENSAKMNATIAKLKARGVADKDMQTQNLSISPLYKYDAPGSAPPRIIGYQATNTLSVKLRDLAAAGSVIDDAVAKGANNLGGIAFTFADPRPLMDKARTAAVEDARRKAELLAKAAGVGLGPVLQITDGYAAAPAPVPMLRMEAAAADAKSTPIAAGESTISATVTIVYEIR
ncbi:MAG: SIMPL domain-containing protein [Parvularculaceae bacterium]|nr:SIMPL domain-containing protein [Parvularculaceae bacterium]